MFLVFLAADIALWISGAWSLALVVALLLVAELFAEDRA